MLRKSSDTIRMLKLAVVVFLVAFNIFESSGRIILNDTSHDSTEASVTTEPEEVTTELPLASCDPSPCGPYGRCQIISNEAACSCLSGYFGIAPKCRANCVLNSECRSEEACWQGQCQNPCPGSCGRNAKCQVVNHLPQCTCNEGYTGDPFVRCLSASSTGKEPKSVDSNAVGESGPECVISPQCAQNMSCRNNKCVNPCLGSCGKNSKCDIVNHSPICYCPKGHTGDPFKECVEFTETAPDPCVPSPCGPNSTCDSIEGLAVCSCPDGYSGDPFSGCEEETLTTTTSSLDQ